jgi:hypothetical protein
MAKAFGSASQPDPAPHQVGEQQRTALRQFARCANDSTGV